MFKCSFQASFQWRVGRGEVVWKGRHCLAFSAFSLRRVYVINKEICVRTVCAHEELLRGTHKDRRGPPVAKVIGAAVLGHPFPAAVGDSFA